MQDTQLTGAVGGSTVLPMQRPALEIPNAKGFGLDEMLAGRRKGGRSARLWIPAQIAAEDGPSESVMSRVLSGKGKMSTRNLQRLAKVLGEDEREVLRAYSVTVQRLAKGAAE